jgi:hypothetical protein
LTNPIIARIKNEHSPEGHEQVAFFCPGCESHHFVNVGKGSPSHKWNGDVEKPTFSPSLLSPEQRNKRCHAFVTNGQIKFLSDCEHEYAGETHQLPPHRILNAED